MKIAKKIYRAAKALSRPVRITRLAGVLGGILFFGLLFNPVEAFSLIVPPGQSITLTWNPSPDSNVTGYNIYFGIASDTYISMVDAGNVTSVTISGLVAGVTYYFAATAHDSLGHESAFSNEISYLAGQPTVRIRGAGGGQLILTVGGQTGHTYEIQATQDLKTWTTIGVVTIGIGVSLDFTDPAAQNFPNRFYRTLDILP